MMDRKGGCLLVPRYGPGPGAGAGSGVGGQAAPGMSWQMGRIMLKFRPIAPKPAAMAPVPTPAPVAAAAGAGRGKRKAAGGSGGRRGRKPKKAATAGPVASVAATQTAPGEKESEKEKSLSSRSSSSSAMTSVDSSPPSPPPGSKPATLPLMPVSSAEEKAEEPASARVAGAQPAPPRPTAPVPVASCWITVEEVTSTWRDGEAPSAAAVASACGADGEAPAFVSDQWGRVTWANAAFTRALVSVEDAAEPAAVALAGALPAWGTCAGFTCRVRVRHSSPRRGGSVVAPCDVWRLDADGCYLWRLDLQAALTLGGLP